MVALLGLAAACASPPPGPSLRGLSPVDAQTCWVSGEHGTVRRTVDGGQTWQEVVVAEAQGADLRDIEAWDAQTAVVMAITEPAALLRTDDGGRTWRETFRHPDPAAFFDSIAFWPAEADEAPRGVAFGDPVDGAFVWLETLDGGASWQPLPVPLPQPLEGEGGFAASGSMVAVAPGGDVWIGTSHYGRLLRRRTWGDTWSAQPSPLRAGLPTAGVFSIAARADGRALAVGGQYDAPSLRAGTAAWTEDGAHWALPEAHPGGYRSGVAWSPDGSIAVAVGPDGVDVTRDGGRTWAPLPGPGWHAVAFSPDGACWVAGNEGRAQRLQLPPPTPPR